MYCNKCGNQISSEDKFCPKCGNNIKGEKNIANNSLLKKLKDNDNWLTRILNKEKNIIIIVRGIILISLFIQSIIYVEELAHMKESDPEYGRFIVPLISAFLTIIISKITDVYKFKKYMKISIITFGLSIIGCWVFMVLYSGFFGHGEYDVAYFLFVGLLPSTAIVAINMVYYYLSILVWYIGHSIVKKFKN